MTMFSKSTIICVLAAVALFHVAAFSPSRHVSHRRQYTSVMRSVSPTKQGAIERAISDKLPALLSSAFFLPIALFSISLCPSPSLAIDQQYKLPPIDYKDTNRCKLESSSIGQANAARDKLYDLRECDLKGQSGAGKDMSGVIASEADFSGVSFKEAQISKGYARNSKFVGCDFTNGIIDRVSFDGSDMTGAIFTNAVLSGTTFANANLKDTDFSDAYLGPFDLKNICLNPSLQGTNPVTKIDTIESAGCR